MSKLAPPSEVRATMVRMRWGKAMQPFEGFQLTLTLVPRTHDRDIIRQLATRLVLQLNSTLPTRPVFDSATTARTNALFRTPTCNHVYSAEVTFGAETFEKYMSQSCTVLRTSGRQSSQSLTPQNKTCSFTGTNCFVPHGQWGVHRVLRMSPLRRTSSTVPGGCCSK